MIREVYPEGISYKTRKVKIGDQWIKVGRNMDLNEIRVKQLNKLVFAEDLDGTLVIVEKQ